MLNTAKSRIAGKNQIKKLVFATTLLLKVSFSYAGLDWTYGALTNADGLSRVPHSLAYSASGNVFVTGVEENAIGHKQIVTKKFSSSGTLLGTAVNSYIIAQGTVIDDYSISISIDNSGNVYVLGRQYATAVRANDIVVIKYNSQLVQQWKKLIYNANSSQQNFNDKPCKLLIDASSNIYVTGTWNNVTITGFMEEIFVQKYSSTGALLYSTTVPQAVGKTIEDAADMCIDNSLNVTLCARAKDGSNVYSILYARITNTGGLSWKKFYTPTSSYSFLGKPQIECTSGGTLYLSSSLDRESPVNNHYGRHLLAKLNSAGTKLWEALSPELNLWADAVVLRLDANNNIYTGSDFAGPNSGGYENHRMYKFNSLGTLLWSFTSAERSHSFRFETYAGTAVFILLTETNPVLPVLIKLDAATGNVIWTENVPHSIPAGYHFTQADMYAMAINPTTSEVALCGLLTGATVPPVINNEYRWYIARYGATTPRLADSENNGANTELSFSVYPNPVNDVMQISNLNSKNISGISIIDATGKVISDYPITSSCMSVETLNLPNGIYFVKVISMDGMVQTKRIIVRQRH